MAQRTLYNQANNWTAILDTTINDSATSVVVASSGSDGAPEVPFLPSIGAERVICTAVTVDTPTAGKDTLTVSRGADGTTAAAHTAGTVVSVRVVAHHFNEVFRALRASMTILCAMLGGGSGVVRTSTGTELAVTAQGSPNMTVNVAVGSAMVAAQPAELRSAATLTFVAPVTNPRIDVVQIDQQGNIEVKTGTEAGSPVAPSVDADALKLAEIALATSTTSIITGLITDSRVFL